MIEHRVQINFRINSEMNFSHTLTRMIDTAEEAEGAGRLDADLITAYNRGYAEGLKEISEEEA